MSERRRKAPGAESDPFQVWREWVDQAERQLNSALAEMMESERFSKSSGRMLDLLMGFQSSMSSATQRYFSTLNLPTRTDVLQLGDRLSSIEERLGLIEQTLVSLAPEPASRRAAPAAPRPKRTKKPPAEAEPVESTVDDDAAANPAAEEKTSRERKVSQKRASKKRVPKKKAKTAVKKKTAAKKKPSSSGSDKTTKRKRAR